MKHWHVVISDPAETDINEIYSYIADTLFEPAAAWRQAERIYNGIFSLSEMPERCSLLPDEPWRSKGLRRLIVDNYYVIYKIQDDVDTVSVIAVIYGRRDMTTMDLSI